MSAEELRNLETLLDNIIVEVQYYSRNELVTLNMIAQPISSADETFLFNKRQRGVYYTNIKFSLEEQ